LTRQGRDAHGRFQCARGRQHHGRLASLALNDAGSASYVGGSGTRALTFSYTVAAGQNTADLTVNALSLNGATIQDASGNSANLSGATNDNPAGILQIDTTPPNNRHRHDRRKQHHHRRDGVHGLRHQRHLDRCRERLDRHGEHPQRLESRRRQHTVVDQGNAWSVNVTGASDSARRWRLHGDRQCLGPRGQCGPDGAGLRLGGARDHSNPCRRGTPAVGDDHRRAAIRDDHGAQRR